MPMIAQDKSTESLTKILKTVSEFTRVAGHRLNIDKRECLLTINEYAYESFINGIKITKICTKYLGIYIGHDKTVCYEKNRIGKLEKL